MEFFMASDSIDALKNFWITSFLRGYAREQ